MREISKSKVALWHLLLGVLNKKFNNEKAFRVTGINFKFET